jgi:hypothetical protein
MPDHRFTRRQDADRLPRRKAHRTWRATTRDMLRMEARRDAAADPRVAAVYAAQCARLAQIAGRTHALAQSGARGWPR